MAKPESQSLRRLARSRYRRIRGLRYHFSCWGEPHQNTALLLHGFMDCGRSFQFLAESLSIPRYLVAPDWRGFGRTEWPHEGYWFPDYLADLDAIVEAFSPQRRVDLVGHSMGGNVACLYAGIRPDRVGRIVNLEGFGLPPSSPDQAPSRYRRWLDELASSPRPSRYRSYRHLAAELQARNPRLTQARASYLARALARRDQGPGVRLRADPRHRRVNPVLYRLEEARACWRSITAPVLFLMGGDSEYMRWLGEFDPQRFRGDISTLTIQRIRGAGHMLHHDVPNELARSIEGFLGASARTKRPRQGRNSER